MDYPLGRGLKQSRVVSELSSGADKIFRLFLAALLAVIPASVALAADITAGDHISSRLVAESSRPVPGSQIALAVNLKPLPGWHIYWSNPGDSGYAPRFSWSVPVGFVVGPMEHPLPTVLSPGGIAINVHAGETSLLTSLRIPSTARLGQAVPLRVAADLLVCSEEVCVPETVTLNKTLAIGEGGADRAASGLFVAARAAMPRALATPAHYQLLDHAIRFDIPSALPSGVRAAHLFVETLGIVPAGAKQHLERRGDGQLILIDDPQMAPRGPISAVLRLDMRDGETQGIRLVALPGAAPSVWRAAAPTRNWAFALALGGALLGGLLLNLMPCVFPILSLKALSLARSGESPGEARDEALGYTVGAIAVVVGLGALLLGLRSVGEAVGWAFQLQNPVVVALLLLLVVAIATNLAGLYELPSFNLGRATGKGFSGGVATGALAAFVATPCTGPFMAGALGTALVVPPVEALAIFAGLGGGLSLPFLLIGFVEPLRKCLPRPGAWMVTLRRLLSLPMFATAVGLAWLLGKQTGVAGMTIGLAGVLLLGVALWWGGLLQSGGRWMLPALVPAAGSIALILAGLLVASPSSGRAIPSTEPFQRYSEAGLARLRAQHRPVFLFATADWCLTCKVNEATSITAASVTDAFTHSRVAVIEADWTKSDPQVSRLLEAHSRAGVPLYLWYPATGGVRELPQILTPAMLVGLTRGSHSS